MKSLLVFEQPPTEPRTSRRRRLKTSKCFENGNETFQVKLADVRWAAGRVRCKTELTSSEKPNTQVQFVG